MNEKRHGFIHDDDLGQAAACETRVTCGLRSRRHLRCCRPLGWSPSVRMGVGIEHNVCACGGATAYRLSAAVSTNCCLRHARDLRGSRPMRRTAPNKQAPYLSTSVQRRAARPMVAYPEQL